MTNWIKNPRPERWAGYRAHHRNRLTGDVVVTVEASAQQIEADSRWVTVCNAHGTLMEDSTLRLATFTRRCPEDWCEDCREIEEAR